MRCRETFGNGSKYLCLLGKITYLTSDPEYFSEARDDFLLRIRKSGCTELVVSNFNTQFSKALKTFLDEVGEITRQAIQASVASAGKGIKALPVATGAKRGPGRPRKNPVGRPPKAKADSGGGTRVKRSAEEIKAIQDKFTEYVTRHNGLRMEVISQAIGIPTKELILPVRQLLSAGTIVASGNKRATTYNVA